MCQEGGEDVEGDKAGVDDEREEVVDGGGRGCAVFRGAGEVADCVEGGCYIYACLMLRRQHLFTLFMVCVSCTYRRPDDIALYTRYILQQDQASHKSASPDQLHHP